MNVMQSRLCYLAIPLGVILGVTATVAGQDSDIEELRREVKRLAEKIDEKDDDRMHFHGYGELHFNFPKTGTMDDRDSNRADFHRFVLGWGYEFSDKIRFDSEIDFEHNASEIELEYALLEFDLLPTLSFRVGSLLMPMGPLNEFHEPPNFYSVERPYLERSIIPTTWQENGLGIAGRALDGDLAYRLYVTAGLDASGFTSLDGLRGGRSKGVKSKLDDFAFIGRLEYSPPIKKEHGQLSLGTSLYYGQADQDTPGLGDVDVLMFEADVRYRIAGFDLKAEIVTVDVNNADLVSASVGETIGETMLGWQVELAYHVFRHILPDRKDDLVTFVRWENFDTNEDVPSGFARNPAADREIWTLGAAYYPTPNVVLKADVELWEDGTGDSVTRVNFGVGFMF